MATHHPTPSKLRQETGASTQLSHEEMAVRTKASEGVIDTYVDVKVDRLYCRLDRYFGRLAGK